MLKLKLKTNLYSAIKSQDSEWCVAKKLAIMHQLSCRCAKFIANALHSDSDVVSYVTRHGVYYGRMLSPIGRNAYFCCSRYGVSLYDIAFITKDFVRSYVRRAQSLDVAYRNAYRMRPPQWLAGMTSGAYWTMVQRQTHLFPKFFVRKTLSPSSSLLLLAKTVTHPAARSLCDSWASC